MSFVFIFPSFPISSLAYIEIYTAEVALSLFLVEKEGFTSFTSIYSNNALYKTILLQDKGYFRVFTAFNVTGNR